MNFQSARIKIPGFRNQPESSELEDLLDLYPEAVLMLETHSKRIRFANQKAAELTLYTRNELYSNDLLTLLPDLDERLLQGRSFLELTNQSISLVKRNKTSVEIQVSYHPLTSKGRWGLLSLILTQVVKKRETERNQPAQYWETIRALEEAIREPELHQALEIALSSVISLSGAENACIYQADGEETNLNLLISTGTSEIFPSHLPPQELALLRSPYVWSTGKRPISNLHTLATERNIPCIVTIPIGDPAATIGLLVIYGSSRLLPGLDIQYLQMLADIAASIIQKHSQTSSLASQIEQIASENTTHQVIEDSIEDAVITLSNDLTIDNLNNAAEVLLGYSRIEARGHPIQEILISEDEIIPIFSMAKEGVSTKKLSKVKLFHRSGHGFAAEIGVVPLILNTTFNGLIVILHDMSEEEEIQSNIKRLEQQAFLGQFQRDFAHEVRNPINNISAGLQFMARNMPADDPNQDAISRIKQDCNRMTELMNTILTYTKITDGDMEPLDIGQIVARVVDRYKIKLTQANVHQHLQIDPDLPPVKGSRRSLEQVFINLIDNAILVMKDKGGTLAVKVHLVRSEEGKEFIEASITDSGPGIPKEEKEHIFQSYFTTSPNGTGLGLVISRKIIAAHNGSIDFESFLGGTIFYTRLPTI